MPQPQSKKPPTQRQLRVGEEIRHAVSSVLMRNEIHEPALEGSSITVSEVRIGPDLKNATVYVTPLAQSTKGTEWEAVLNRVAPNIRKSMSRYLHLKYLPKLHFKLDKSFDSAGRINEILLKDERVQADIHKIEHADDE